MTESGWREGEEQVNKRGRQRKSNIEVSETVRQSQTDRHTEV